jgi:tRNA(fMet)-specific endonuclease VapC
MPIPENDIWIAATAIQFGLTLISRDNHFVFVDNLSVEQWQILLDITGHCMRR